MRIKNIYLLVPILTTLIFMFSGIVTAGGWTDKVLQVQPEWVNDIVSRDTSGAEFFIVGDNAYFAFSDNGGFGWKQIPIPSTDRIEAVDVLYDIADTTVIAVGQGGSVFRVRQKSLFDENTPVPEDLHAVTVNGNRIWIAGDNGRIYYSDDKGDSWIPGAVNGNIVNFTSLISTPYGVYASAFWNTKSYILSDENNDTVFEFVDSLDNVMVKSAFADFGRLYFAGENTMTGTGALLVLEDLGGTYGTMSANFPPEVDFPITDISGVTDTFEKIWVTTANGFIYMSDRWASTFGPVYQNMEGKSLNAITVSPNPGPQPVAIAAGSDGLIARYDFMVRDMFPFMNEFSYPAQTSLQISFTTVTDIASVQNGIFIQSSIQGFVPFTVSYFPGDSTTIEIFIQNSGSIPGEIWTIILSNNIRENISLLPFDKTFNYQLFAISSSGQNFLNSSPTPLNFLGTKTSNFVTGFFTEDDIFDLVTITSDSIYLFPGTPSGESSPPLTEALASPLSLNSGITDQIRTMDINLDGWMDLVVFDDNMIQTYIKEPDASPNPFRFGASYFSNNIRDVEVYSADQDALMDLAIINDSLQTRVMVDESSFGFQLFGDPGMDWSNVELRDIDADAFTDFAGLTPSGDIVLRHMVAWEGFDQETMIPGPFDKFILADIDDDRQMEVLAQNREIIRIFHKDPDWQFSEMTVINQGDPDSITSFIAHDFNNDRFLDVVITATGKKFKVFQNIGASFSERFDVERIIEVEPTGLTPGDFDMDASLDVVAYDSDLGQFQVIRNLPGPGGQQVNIANFDSIDVSSGAIYLGWKEFDPIIDLDFYNIFRGPDTLSMVPIATSFTNSYVDSTVAPGSIYWYRVEAMNLSAMAFPMTGNLEVIIPFELSGSISGVLSDTLFPYLVTGPIEVRQDSSLLITEGVELVFEPEAGLTVYGNLDVTGTEEAFVNFRAKDDRQPWLGVTISGIVNTDTVRFHWFDIEGANEGMRDRKPARMFIFCRILS